MQLLLEQYNNLLDYLNEGSSSRPYASYHLDLTQCTQVVKPHVQEKQMVKLNGVTFACRSKHIGNSRILFTFPGDTIQCAGEIQRIFIHQHRGLLPDNSTIMEFFYVVRQFEELTEEQVVCDPYCQFPLLCAHLCSQRMSREQVIRNQNIISHFATCPYEGGDCPGEFFVVLLLNRVSAMYPAWHTNM